MINIFFNVDDNYISKCKTVIRSILAHSNADITFYIIGVKNFEYKANIRCYDKPDLSSLNYKTQIRYISMASTYRLFAPYILDVNKAIYLDCDLVVLDDIEKLWRVEPEYLAGVQDPLFTKHANRNGLRHTYINSGVMVINLENLRQINYLDRIKATQNGFYDLSLLDQDIINIAFENEIELLPLEWNVYSKIYPETTYDMIKARDNPSIIHWCGCQKPWNSNVWQADKWSKYEHREF